MGFFPPSAQRVERNTSERINRRIQQRRERSVRHHAAHRDEIDDRLRELDAEWDTERTLEANAATLTLAGILLSIFVDRRFIVLPLAVAGFLLQHALQGWCPPLPILRRRGVRTRREIDEERADLRALRGDFAGAER